jgi:hypothetical protein
MHWNRFKWALFIANLAVSTFSLFHPLLPHMSPLVIDIRPCRPHFLSSHLV